MTASKPRIRPKSDPRRHRSEDPLSDPPTYPEHDEPIFTERDPGAEQKAPERVLFQEDDCLR